jgi:nicotinate-nucleotide pyrophosphorylase (carboxylating)
MNTLISTWKHFITLGLSEDSVAFDWTARSAQLARSKKENAKATLVAKQTGVWAGESGLVALKIVSAEMGMPLEITSKVKDGEQVSPGQKICEWSGDPQAILVFERTFINLASYACGIATQTQQLVQKVKAAGLKHTPRIVPTRKTLPGYRDLAIQSSLIGGAHPHRFNLSGGLLLKENHLAAAGGISLAIKAARETAPHLLKIEVEVRSITELKMAIHEGAEVIMLDNFTPEQIKEAIRQKPTHGTLYEVSGGINLNNIEPYIIEGVDVISVGSITHSVKALDLSLLMNDVK